MGEIEVGDVIMSLNERATTVVYVTPIIEDKECYEISFSDGAKITADGEHQWMTWTTFRPNPTIRTTLEIMRTVGDGHMVDHRFVTGIRSVPSVPVRCISVDDPSSMFLCGETMIPTHNTSMCMAIALEGALKGQRILWGAPVYDQVRIGFNETRKALRGYGDINLTRMEIHLKATGGQILFRSLDDPESVKGHTADGAVLDEAALLHPDAWYESIRPMLATTRGWVWLISTPRSKNWFYDEWMRFDQIEDGAAWQIPSFGCKVEGNGVVRDAHPYENPYLDMVEMVTQFNGSPMDTFKQEWLAEFLENEGGVFRNIKACLLVTPNDEPILEQSTDKHRGHVIVMGSDWAQKHDYTVFSVFCSTCMEEVELMRLNNPDFEYLRNKLMSLARKWQVKDIIVEENYIGAPNLEALVKAGMPARGFYTSPSSKPRLIQSLALAFEQEQAKWLSIKWAKDELLSYQMKVMPITGRVQYSAERGKEKHDDSVISRALSLYASLNPGVIQFY